MNSAPLVGGGDGFEGLVDLLSLAVKVKNMDLVLALVELVDSVVLDFDLLFNRI